MGKTSQTEFIPLDQPLLGSGTAHSNLINSILKRCGGDGRAVLWRNDVGLFYTRQGKPISISLKGSPDIIGFLRNGKFIGIECKTGQAVQNNAQKAFERVCKSMQTLYFVARDPNEISRSIDAELA